MAKLLTIILISLSLVLTCTATTYTVGDSCGWDISCDFSSWTIGKNFKVGDALSFQYSSYHNVYELSKDSFDSCNTSNPIKMGSNGNTTISLSSPGIKYFACGNKLHCLGGMKLQLLVNENQANSPASAPLSPIGSPSSSLPVPSSKNNNPGNPTSAGSVYRGWTCLLSCSLAIAISTYVFAF